MQIDHGLINACYLTLYSMLWANPAVEKLMIFLRKKDPIFHANYLLTSRQLARNVKSYFLGKIREMFKMLSAEIPPSMTSDNKLYKICRTVHRSR